MRKIEIFEPPMCCPTGLCGVSLDQELLRVAGKIDALQKSGADIQRFNLTSSPLKFIENVQIRDFLQHFGTSKLPVVTVDGFIVMSGRYPTNEEFNSWLEDNSCNCDDGCCLEEDCGCDSTSKEHEANNSCNCGEECSPEEIRNCDSESKERRVNNSCSCETGCC